MWLIASKAGNLTGKHLAKAIGLNFQSNIANLRDGSEILIRYGNAQLLSNASKDTDCNSREAILKMSAKHKLWEYLDGSNVLTPRYYKPINMPNDLQYPFLVRSNMHRAGKDIVICSTLDDMPLDAQFVVPFYPTLREYRVHVAFGKVVKVLRKYPVNKDSNETIRTSAFGWRYKVSDLEQVLCAKSMVETALKTAEILNAQFCGIDMAWSSKKYGLNKWIVWEVNSAPSLNASSLKLYTDIFKENFSERLRKYEIYKSKQNHARSKAHDRRY